MDCRVEFHSGKTCVDYLKEKKEATDLEFLDGEFDKAAINFKYKPCPSCKVWIEKNQVKLIFFCLCLFLYLLKF